MVFKYHAGKYILPNDSDEQERMDIMYHAFRLSTGDKLFYAPIAAPTGILDVGTGTGIWAIDVADAYPAAEVVATDLSPIQPHYVPQNLQFEIEDADEEWTFKPKFDLVHSRVLNDTSFKDWWHFYRQAFKVLKPGGWVESQEIDYHSVSDDNTIDPNCRLKVWEDEWTRGVNKIGLRGGCDPDLVIRQMTEAGFVNISRLDFKMPIGPWPKDPTLRKAGAFGLVNLLEGFHGLSVKVFTQLCGWSIEELELLLMECRQELKQKGIHRYFKL
jgi:SAM-dependent methyltransferase